MIKNMKTKMLPMLLSMLLIFSVVLAGCSKSGNSGDGNNGQSQTSGNTAATKSSGSDAGTENSAGGSTESQKPADTAPGTDESAGALQTQETAGGQPETVDPGSSEISAVFHLDLLENKGLHARVKEIIVDPNGSSFVFWTTKTLTDLKLISVEYNGDQFLEGKVYCSYDEFTSEDAILLTHSFPESMPDLKITFYDETGTARMFYISQSGQDASPLLITEEALLFGN